MVIQPGSTRPANSPARDIHILIADDFEPWRVQVRYLLQERPGWRVICEASDGALAVEKAQEFLPDLVLLDIGMPGLSGIEAARAIRQVSPASRIIFLTQYTESDVREAALAAGAQGYVLKSKAALELLAAIAAALEVGST